MNNCTSFGEVAQGAYGDKLNHPGITYTVQ